MKLVTVKEVRAAFDDAEAVFATCWSFLAQLREHKAGASVQTPLAEFQPTLAAVLFRLTNLHGRLSKDAMYLVERKPLYSPGWLAKKLALIAKWKSGLHDISEMGRALGDAFVWLFIRADARLLELHQREPRPHMMPTGIGGRGELAFIRTVRSLHGHYVLYHGITSCLRLGDISLIDRNFRIAAIGELKSHSLSGDELHTSVTFTGSSEKLRGLVAALQSMRPGTSLPKPITLSNANQDRFKRQMDRMTKSLADAAGAESRDHKLNLEVENRVSIFADFVRGLKRGRFSYVNPGGGLLLGGIRHRRRLFHATFGRHGAQRLDGLEAAVTGICLRDRKDNSLSIGHFFYTEQGVVTHPGLMPMLWWPVPTDVAMDVYLRHVSIFTTYNFAHFYRALEDCGFTIVSKYPNEIRAQIVSDGKRFESVHLEHFQLLINQYLFDEASIARGIKGTQEEMIRLNIGPDTRVNMAFVQHFGPLPKEPA